MKKIVTISMFLSICTISTVTLADDNERQICGSVKPLLSVTDFNGNDVVDPDDVNLISGAVKKDLYYAIYDVDTDGEVDNDDVQIVKQQLGMVSQPIDQQLAFLFNRNKQFQQIDNVSEITAMGYFEIASSLAGHGEH